MVEVPQPHTDRLNRERCFVFRVVRLSLAALPSVSIGPTTLG